jgi:predicted helicase
LVEANPRWLQDDYLKFIRLSQSLLDEATIGIVGLITNHAYLDNATFRGARQSLIHSFSRAWFLDLHGNTKKAEKDLDGSADKNVFEIQQGVAITLLVRTKMNKKSQICHGDLFGNQEYKYDYLKQRTVSNTEWRLLNPISPFYLFIPQDQTFFAEYQSYVKITDAMPVHSNGVVTARDHMCIGWDAEDVWATVQRFSRLKPDDAREQFELGADSRDWQVKLAQADLLKDGPSRERIVPIYYRPFDIRWTYFTGRSRGFLCMPRGETMANMLTGKNIALITSRMTKGEIFQHVQVTRNISEAIVMSPKTSNNGFLFPLYLLPDRPQSGNLTLNSENTANYDPIFLREIANKLNVPQTISCAPPGDTKFEDIFHYAYAVFYSPSYRFRYAEFLKVDFPRLPLTPNHELFPRWLERARILQNFTCSNLRSSLTPTASSLDAKIRRSERSPGPMIPFGLRMSRLMASVASLKLSGISTLVATKF